MARSVTSFTPGKVGSRIVTFNCRTEVSFIVWPSPTRLRLDNPGEFTRRADNPARHPASSL